MPGECTDREDDPVGAEDVNCEQKSFGIEIARSGDENVLPISAVQNANEIHYGSNSHTSSA